MSEWTARTAKHPIWSSFSSIRAEVEQVTFTAEDQPESSADLVRVQTVLLTVESRLKSADPLLLQPGPLGSIDSHLQKIGMEIAAFRTSRNREHLVNANNQADSILSYAGQLGLPTSSTTSEATDALNILRERSEEISGAFVEQERRVRGQLTRLEQEVQAAMQEISSQKGRLDTAIAEYQQQFSTAESARQTQVAAALKTHTQRLDQALSDAQKRLEESTQSASKRLEATLQDASQKATLQQTELSESSSDVIAELGVFRSKAENLLHVIGSTGMAGEYQKVANSARKATITWQCIAGVSMVCLIAFAISAYLATQDAEIRWGAVAARLFVTATFGILAAYAARQSDRYSDVEVRNRRFQLELSSIDPYLANLPTDTQHKVKVDLAQKLFGNASGPILTPSKEFSGTGKDPLELALSILMEFVKKRG